ncbi:GTP 3',8-cyclase MoaA [Schaalia sp. ZJ1691]|uniref:GTP 3',8-cyclase MoaA n=1 Tax=Schaalia sp. ZJ1691 TaxID=2709404 RepID=UPI0013EBDED1|nr:GTP 3',8-cyclase MoaA [Schaalia sp. ZJ1691]
MVIVESRMDALHDRYGRVARDLRVSLTDRCNLRCSYCMPAEGMQWMPTDKTLTDDEVIRLCTIGVHRLGIRKIRFTGGEPLLRSGLERIISHVSALRTDLGTPCEVALTTNALGLTHRANSLVRAGLTRVNISLDTIDPDHFLQITRRDRLGDVLAGIDSAHWAGLAPIKVNAVLMRGINDADAPDLLDFCLDRNIELRIIEQMPIGPPEVWTRQGLITRDEILGLLSTRHQLSPVEGVPQSSPARLWSIDGDSSRRVGIIASVSAPFCGSCNRTRLTSDGQIRSCLFSTQEFDLRTLMRGGADDEQLAREWARAMWMKPAAHGLDGTDFAVPSRTMSAIGG